MPKIKLRGAAESGREVEASVGTTLAEALAWPQPCGGRGTCGRCRVVAHGVLNPLTLEEQRLLAPAALLRGERLACQARVMGEVTVTVAAAGAARNLPPQKRIWTMAPENAPICLGFDVGTTTVAGLLYTRDGATVWAATSPNPQRRVAADVMGRIAYTMERTDGLDKLRDDIRETLNALGDELLAAAGLSEMDVATVALAGNPTMAQLVMGLPVAALGSAPYPPGYREMRSAYAAAWGLLWPDAEAYMAPCASGFVGGDALAAALVCGLDQPGGWRLLVDIGTNTELLLTDGRVAYACAAAAGPALEAAQIRQGLPAEGGAIRAVRVENGALRCEVIGGGQALGLCGSGLIDALAALLELGWLGPDGALMASAPRLDEQRVARLADGVWLTQQDVRQAQLAIGAVAAGVSLLLEQAGIDLSELEALHLCGAFGAHLNPASAMRIGLLPTLPPGILQGEPDAAAWGALTLAADPLARERIESLRARIHAIDLAAVPAFTQRFVEKMRLETWGEN